MKRMTLLFVAIMAASLLPAQQSAGKILVKPVSLQGSMVVDVEIDGGITVEKWGNDYAQVEMSITAYGVNNQALKSLVAAGRYNIKIDREGDRVILSAPDLSKTVKVRGNVLKDEVELLVYVPEGCTVNTAQSIGMVIPK